MTRVVVTSTLDDLANDAASAVTGLAVRCAAYVRDTAHEGNRRAKASARINSGEHGKNYPDAFSAEARTPYIWEYGPDVNHPGGQGGMAFEDGPGPQTAPHNNLANSTVGLTAKADQIFEGGYLAR